MTKNPVVLVAERPHDRIDLSKASLFGEVKFLLQESDPSAFDTDAYVTNLSDRLDQFGFDPAVDFFCVAGPTSTVAFVMSAMFKKYGILKVLLFSPGARSYLSRTVDLRSVTALANS